MKKILTVTLLLSMLLCGCSQSKSNSTISNPYEISVKGDVLSYYGEKSEFKNAGFDISNKALESSQSKKNNIFVGKEDSVRSIVITSKDITTFKDISVGDSVDEIESSFKYENSLGNNYAVLFNGTTEIDSKDKSATKQDDFILINYATNGKTIEKITIYDVLYGREMR